jgi:hypothetical protein
MLPDDAAALLLESLDLRAALKLPAPLLRAYLRNHTRALTSGAPPLTARETCRLATALHSVPTLASLRLRLRHAAYDPLTKQCSPSVPGSVESLCAALPALPRLQALGLSHCQARADGTAALAAVLYTLPQLTSLEFACNGAGAALAGLARELPALRRLEVLDLSDNGAPGAAWGAITAAVSRLPALQTLVYGSGSPGPDQNPNAFDVDSGSERCKTQLLGPLSTLRSICLSGAQRLPSQHMIMCAELVQLDMLNVLLDAGSCVALFAALRVMPALEHLRLLAAIDYVTTDGAEELGVACMQWPTLTHLTLHDAPATSAASHRSTPFAVAVVRHLPACSALRELQLATERAGGLALAAAAIASKLPALTRLALDVFRRTSSRRAYVAARALASVAMELPRLAALRFGAAHLLEDDEGDIAWALKRCAGLRDVALDCQVGAELLVGLVHLQPQLEALHVKGIDIEVRVARIDVLEQSSGACSVACQPGGRPLCAHASSSQEG